MECVVRGLPAGLGDPCFDKLDANLAKAILSVGAVKGFEIGSGFGAAKLRGSENNDPFVNRGEGIEKERNNAGGTLGGISDGSPLVRRAAIKPTSSIAAKQHTVNPVSYTHLDRRFPAGLAGDGPGAAGDHGVCGKVFPLRL